MTKNITENKKPKTCQAIRHEISPCGRPLYDNKHCIFHSKDIERKKKEFNDAFWKEFDRQKKEDKVYDFREFIFPGAISFNNIKFEKSTHFYLVIFSGENTDFSIAQFLGENTSFSNAKFSGETFFNGAKFSGGTSFSDAQFLGKISFFNTQFLGENTSFSNAQFSGETFFNGAKFSGGTSFSDAQFLGENSDFSIAQFLGEETSFSDAQFSGETLFNLAQFSGNIDFNYVQFSGKNTYFIGTQFLGKETDFTKTQFSGKYTYFSDAQFSGKSICFFNSYFKNIWYLFEALRNTLKEEGISRRWKGKYKLSDFRFQLGEESAKRHPVIDRMTKDAWYLNDYQEQHPFVYKIWNISSKCGQSILRWAVLSLGISVLFAIIFIFIGPDAFKPRDYTWFSWFYYSIVTFTTLGFGDITPIKWFTEILVTVEVILGYTMLGGLISIFANKLARRS